MEDDIEPTEKLRDSEIETEAIVQPCKTCSQPFCTYISGTNFVMPDGTSLFYSNPQQGCPCCDINQWGAQWNQENTHGG